MSPIKDFRDHLDQLLENIFSKSDFYINDRKLNTEKEKSQKNISYNEYVFIIKIYLISFILIYINNSIFS